MGFVVYRIEISSPAIAVPSLRDRATLLDELCNGRAAGPAWSQLRQHVDADGLEALAFRSRQQLTALVLLQKAHLLVSATAVGPAFWR